MRTWPPSLLLFLGMTAISCFAIDSEVTISIDSKKGTNVEAKASIKGSLLKAVVPGDGSTTLAPTPVTPSPSSSPSPLTDSDTFFKNIGQPEETTQEPTRRKRTP